MAKGKGKGKGRGAQGSASGAAPSAPAVKPPEIEVKDVPEFKDSDGKLLKLRRKDFPKTKEGRTAFCDYQISRWEDRKVRVAKADDPTAKAQRKLESYRKKMKELEEQIKVAQAEQKS